MAFTSLSNIAPFERLWIIRQPRNIILRNTRATIVLGASQFIRCIPLSKREAKIKNQAGFFVCGKFTLQVNLGDKSGVNRPFNLITSQVNSTMKTFFYHTDLGQNLLFFALFKPIILQYFTILQDKLHSFNIQDDKGTRFAFCLHNKL